VKWQLTQAPVLGNRWGISESSWIYHYDIVKLSIGISVSRWGSKTIVVVGVRGRFWKVG
jgi:hypothetical protein